MLQKLMQSQQVAVPLCDRVLFNHAQKEGCNRNSISQKWTLHIKYSDWIFAQFLSQSQQHCQIRKSGGFCPHFCCSLQKQGRKNTHPVGPRKGSQYAEESAAISMSWSLSSTFQSSGCTAEPGPMWQWVCPAPAKMRSSWLSPAHILFLQTEPVITSCTTCLDSWGPSATPITEPFTCYSFILAMGQGNQWRHYFSLHLKNIIPSLRHQKMTGITCQFHLSPWAQSQPCSRPFHTALFRATSLLSKNKRPICRTAQLRKGEGTIRLCCLMQPTECHAPISLQKQWKTKNCCKLHSSLCFFAWR